MFRICVGPYTVQLKTGGLPAQWGTYRARAALLDEHDLPGGDGEICALTVSRGGELPLLAVAQAFEPATAQGFFPGAVLIEETDTLFLGAGRRLLAYRLRPLARLWEETVVHGFWGWRRHGSVVLMSSELELAAFDLNGRRLWSTFVEPPWSYVVEGDWVLLDVMGRRSEFPLHAGPA